MLLFRNVARYVLLVSIALLSQGAAVSAASLQLLYHYLPITDTLTVFLQERPAGTLISSLSASESGIVNRMHLSVVMTAPGGTAQQIVLEEQRYFGQDGMLQSARQRMESPAGTSAWELHGDADSLWKLAVTTAGVVNCRNIAPVKEPIGSLAALYTGVIEGTLRKGTTWNDTAVELTSGELVATRTRCVGTPADTRDSCWEFTCYSDMLDRTEVWKLDRRGKTIYREMFPYTGRMQTAGAVSAQVPAGEADAMFEMMKINVPERLAAGKQRVQVTFGSANHPDTSVARFYEVVGGKWYLKPFTKKCTEAAGDPLTPEARKSLCSATPTLQSSHERIQRVADSLSRGVTGSCALVKTFNHAVYRMLAKRNVATFSSALETLDAGYGDCGEHAVLLAALLRAAGVPARVVLGVLHVESKKGYYYHAWVMAYTGTWVFADPSHDMFPASADRVPLVFDDDGTHMLSVAKLIGRIAIKHVPIRKTTP